MKDHVLECFETGFVSHFEYPVPEPWGHVENYEPLTSYQGRVALTNAMKSQVVQGKMIGGPGWTAELVKKKMVEEISTAYRAGLWRKTVRLWVELFMTMVTIEKALTQLMQPIHQQV